MVPYGIVRLAGSRARVDITFRYFSFVTLATLGYGDIAPKAEFAQRLAITEAIMGQFYGSLVVAYLLSLYLGHRISVHDTGSSSGRGSDNSA